MSVVSYLVLAIALGISNMLLFCRCAKAASVRLSAGLVICMTVSLIHVVFYWAGTLIGSLLSLQSPVDPGMYSDTNAYIFLGLAVAVLLKQLVPYLRRNPRLPVFNLGDTASTLALAAASGFDVMLLGIGVGFADNAPNIHLIIWPLLAFDFLLGYLGIMFGRQKVHLRHRRWMVIASILILGVAIAAAVNA